MTRLYGKRKSPKSDKPGFSQKNWVYLKLGSSDFGDYFRLPYAFGTCCTKYACLLSRFPATGPIGIRQGVFGIEYRTPPTLLWRNKFSCSKGMFSGQKGRFLIVEKLFSN